MQLIPGRSRANVSRGERGATAMEFALLLPVFILVLAALLDFGRAVFTQVTITNAAREGARVAIGGAGSADIETRVNAAAPMLTGMTTTVAATCAGGTGEGAVTTATPFDWVVLGPALGLFGGGGGLPATLDSTARFPC
jgi:Flp pilus assembly protein TadG